MVDLRLVMHTNEPSDVTVDTIELGTSYLVYP